MKHNTIKVIAFLVVLIALFVTVSPSENYTDCRNQQRFFAKAFDGILVKKYLDEAQHSIPVIEVKERDNHQTKKISLFGEYSGLFSDSLAIGDTIKKDVGDLRIIIRHGDNIKTVTASFDCDSISFKKEERSFGFFYKIFSD